LALKVSEIIAGCAKLAEPIIAIIAVLPPAAKILRLEIFMIFSSFLRAVSIPTLPYVLL